MKVRQAVALAVAVPALVLGLAQPGSAQSFETVSFEGTFQLKPTALPTEQTTNLCFFASVSCANGEVSRGMAAGLGADVSAIAPDAVDGLQATAAYVELCSPGTGFPPVGSAKLSGNVHHGLSGAWSSTVSATWTRAGLVAVIQGDAIGTALFTPVGVPACGVASPVAVAGVVELAY